MSWLISLQLLSFTLGVTGKWLTTSKCQTKRRRGFALVVVSGVIFNSILASSGLYISAVGGAVLIAIDLRGYLHNA